MKTNIFVTHLVSRWWQIWAATFFYGLLVGSLTGCTTQDTRYTQYEGYDDASVLAKIVKLENAGVIDLPDGFWEAVAANGLGGGTRNRSELRHRVRTLFANASQERYNAFITNPAEGGWNVNIGGTGQKADSTEVPLALNQTLSQGLNAYIGRLMAQDSQEAARPPDQTVSLQDTLTDIVLPAP